MQPKLYPHLSLALLTALNVLNFIDRNVLLAIQPLVKQEFHSTDAALGLLTTAFFFTYMCCAPVVGWMGDRYSRKILLVAGIILWSGLALVKPVLPLSRLHG